jgi:glycosyltransferase involved in cell wall biosynthesis
MERPRRIFGFVGRPMTGVGYVRFVQPFAGLEELGYELVTLGENVTIRQGPDGFALDEAVLEEIDAVIFPQLVASPRLRDGSRIDLVGSTCRHAAAKGIKIIWSVDDYLPEIEERNPAYRRIRSSIDNIETIIEHADALLVTTPKLMETLSHTGKPIHLLPNAIDPARWRERLRVSTELRVGWAGSSSHIEDLLMVLPAIRKLQERIPFSFILQGIVERPIAEEAEAVRGMIGELSGPERETADAFLEMTGMLGDIRYAHLPFTSMDEYFDILPALDLDIGICPLADTPFNRHKSALKFYEYAVCGFMTVASAVTPYEDEPCVTTANDPGSWVETLERYLIDDERRELELLRQRAWVFAERNIERLRHDWADALETIIKPVPCGARE